MKYDIMKVRLDGVPKIPYADGVGKHRGICMHSTANYGSGEKEDTAMNERNWEQGHWNDAFVHYFCDYTMILDVADDDYISYGCGKGNPYYINNELCQTKRADRFIESYNRWIYIAAKVLFDNKLGVIDGVTLVSHRWVSQNLGGTHDDPHAYIESHGKKWSDVVADVKNVYKQFENEVSILSNQEDEEKMLQDLQAQLQQLQSKVAELDKRTGNEALADWSNPSIQKAYQIAQKHGEDFDVNEGTRDFHRIIVILDRMGLLDMALKG